MNTPTQNARNAYDESWTRIDERRLHYPAVVDVWDSEEDMNAFMTQLGPILDEFGMRLAARLEIGDLLQIVRAPSWPIHAKRRPVELSRPPSWLR